MNLEFYDQKNSRLRLLELNGDVLGELEQGKKVTIRGSDTDEAVLCTQNNTYKVKSVETSNSLLVSDFGVQRVHYPLARYYELENIPPRTTKLYRILEETAYSGEINEKSVNQKNVFTFDELLSIIQASETELTDALNKVHAFLYRGKWRTFAPHFASEMSEMVLATAVENDWSLDDIDTDVVKEQLKIYDSEIVSSWIQQFTSKDESQKTKLNKELILYYEGIALLRENDTYQLSSFLSTWSSRAPLCGSPSLSLLRGFAVLIENPFQTVKYLSVLNLPFEPRERLRILFSIKKEWRLDEITPYLEDLTKTPAQFLLQFAQVIKKNEVSVYISRAFM